jgi:transcriptional regulator with XRE-family HTH domain
MLDPMVSGPPQRDQRTRPLLRTTLGNVLRRTRREQRRTLADVARAAKVSMPYLSEVERGRKEVSSEVLAAICGALGVELADVLVQVGRDLVHRDLGRRDPLRPAPVYRLDVVRGLDGVRGLDAALSGTMAPPVRRSGDARCLLAA